MFIKSPLKLVIKDLTHAGRKFVQNKFRKKIRSQPGTEVITREEY